MQVIVVRHGQTEANLNWQSYPWNHNLPLNETGKKQAQQASKLIQDILPNPSILLTSPLIRTRQTGDVIATHLQIAPSTDDRLKEAIIGDWQSKTVKEVVDFFAALPVNERAIYRPPNGETWLERGKRVANLIKELEGKRLESAILVSHSALVRCGVGTLLGTNPGEWEDIDTPPGSVTLLTNDSGSWSSVFIGKTN